MGKMYNWRSLLTVYIYNTVTNTGNVWETCQVQICTKIIVLAHSISHTVCRFLPRHACLFVFSSSPLTCTLLWSYDNLWGDTFWFRHFLLKIPEKGVGWTVSNRAIHSPETFMKFTLLILVATWEACGLLGHHMLVINLYHLPGEHWIVPRTSISRHLIKSSLEISPIASLIAAKFPPVVNPLAYLVVKYYPTHAILHGSFTFQG